MAEFQQIQPRYQPDSLQPDERWNAAQTTVRAAIVNLFGSGLSLSDGDFTVGGMGYITHNGLPTKNTRMSDTPGGRRLLEKARRDIAARSAEIRVRELAERITLEDLQHDIQEIRTWARSLQRTI